ncbi:uncharacterized protein LOC124499923 isoform X3 [Dermatophagoides farinae]
MSLNDCKQQQQQQPKQQPQRLCQSEMNLNNDKNDDHDYKHSTIESLSNEIIHHHYHHNNQLQQNDSESIDSSSSSSSTLPTYRYGSNLSSNSNSSTNINNNGMMMMMINNCPINGVAAKIHRIRHRNSQISIQKPINLNEMIINDDDDDDYKIDSSSNDNDNLNYPKQQQQQQLLTSQQQQEIAKNMKIKRSVSNFDSNYLGKMKLKSHLNSLLLMDDNPWRLKRPEQNPNNTNLLAQYLSFEFLNERIHNRLQQEIECSPNNTWRCLNFQTSKSDSATGVNSNNKNNLYTTQSSQRPIKSSDTLIMAKNFSCSEMNLSTATKQARNKQTKQKTVNKRKSFKKFLEHYFHNESTNTRNASVSSEELLTGFDQNFILKRNTPNAGLTDDELYKTSNWEYYHGQQSTILNHSLRTCKKSNRTSSSSSSSTLVNSCYGTTNSKQISNVDKQLEMVANLFNNQCNNGFEDTDYLSVSKHFISNANGDNNQMIAGTTNDNYSDELLLFGHKSAANAKNFWFMTDNNNGDDNGNGLQRKLPYKMVNNGGIETETKSHHWIPSNDLSSSDDSDCELIIDDDDDDDDDATVVVEQQSKRECFDNIIEETIANIEVEDFLNGHIYEDIDHRLFLKRYLHHNNDDDDDDDDNNNLTTSSATNIRNIPDGPCFTLSNQLKTLLQNSNRLKNHYLYY